MDGLLIVNKEKGFTSFDVVAKLRGILGEKKIGHLGTLDPEAEGVLPVLVGRATKLAPLLSEKDKIYRAMLLLGVESDSQDATGRLIKRTQPSVTEEEVREAILSFVGDQMQLPPMVSAKKVEGKKLVDLARAGREVERKTCPIKVYDIQILSMNLPRVEMRIHCSAGTYIRTLCHDIGQELGCGGVMESLVREAAGNYELKDALKLDEITSCVLTGSLSRYMLSLRKLLRHFAGFVCHSRWEKLAFNGNPLRMDQGDLEKPVWDGFCLHVMQADRSSIGLFRYSEKEQLLRPEIMIGREEAEGAGTARPTVIALGKFDGVHRGHQAIMEEVLRQAEAEKMGSLVFSFTNTPESLAGGGKTALLTTTDEKRELLRAMGIRKQIEARFTKAMRDMPAERFLEEILIGRYGMKRIVVGPDCSFGAGREGNVEYLKVHADQYGYQLTVVEKIREGNDVISSSLIKELVLQGRLEEAGKMMGRPFSFRSRVVYGAGLGHALGFPTANQTLPEGKILPPYGVYFSRVWAGDEAYFAMSNLGVKPSLKGDGGAGLESHLFDYEGDLYGKTLRTELLSFIRPEEHFESLEALKQQLQADREKILQLHLSS